jgi:ribonuclease HI
MSLPHPHRSRPLKIFFDGGCQPNPGRIEVALVAGGVTYFVDGLGDGTSHDAEWLALLEALRLAQSLGVPEYDLVGDCANVIAQVNGVAKCRTARSAEYQARFRALAASGPPRRIRWTARTQNLAGIALARRRGR